jgi:hypothetical protein
MTDFIVLKAADVFQAKILLIYKILEATTSTHLKKFTEAAGGVTIFLSFLYKVPSGFRYRF